jgi:hypothetical protein
MIADNKKRSEAKRFSMIEHFILLNNPAKLWGEIEVKTRKCRTLYF